jgi:predicted Zn finger-like uncharacterized protein
MNIRCPNCQTTFRVDPARVPVAGIRARCARCSATFRVTRDGAATSDTAAGTPAAAPAAGASQATRPAEPQQEAAPASQARSEPAAVHGTAATTPAPAAQPSEPQKADTRPPQPATAAASAQAQPGAQPGQASRPAPPAQPTQGSSQASQGAQPPAAAPATADNGASKTEFVGDSSPGRSGATIFGSRDPNARAQRIARALVSDIVAYHPKRRDASLEAGTLRADFREEIMKSWEEYVAQVGLDMAKSTPYFRDALNAILARGQSIF